MKVCKYCRSKTRVLDTRPTSIGTRRRLECAGGHRITTFEVTDSLLFRLATDVMMEPGFFSRDEKKMEKAFEDFIDYRQKRAHLKLVKDIG